MAANRHSRRLRRGRAKADPKETSALEAGSLPEPEEAGEAATETESSTDGEVQMAHADPDADDRILKLLYKGNLEEANRSDAQKGKSHCVSHKHNVYRNTRCTSTAQEEQSALPAGVSTSPTPSAQAGLLCVTICFSSGCCFYLWVHRRARL